MLSACQPPCVDDPNATINFTIDIQCLINQMCQCHNNEAASFLFSYGDYLYPFSIEFSILIGRVILTRVNAFQTKHIRTA